MPRVARQASAAGYYHVVARGHNRQAIFRDSQDYQQYLIYLSRFKEAPSCRCYHFCLMPNHLHLLLGMDSVRSLTGMMRRVQQAYQFHWRRRYDLVGNLWQGRFKSIPVDQDEYLLEASRYIERNPVRAKLCVLPEDYPWSSAHLYLKERSKGCGLLDLSPAYLMLGSSEEKRRQRYREHIMQVRPYDQLVDAQMERLI